MTVKYAIKNYDTQQYVLVNTPEEAEVLLAEYALDRYINFECHGEICSMVKINDDATEEWYTQTGESRLSPAAIKLTVQKQFRPRLPLKDIPLIPSVTI
jgi:hypothetical protein